MRSMIRTTRSTPWRSPVRIAARYTRVDAGELQVDGIGAALVMVARTAQVRWPMNVSPGPAPTSVIS